MGLFKPGLPLLSALFPLIGGAVKAVQDKRQRAEDQARQDDQLQRMMVDAGLAGIHPVAALGTSANYGSPVGGDTGAFGEGIAQAGGALQDYSLAQQDFQISAQALELERMRLDNEARAFALQEAQSRSILMGLRQGSSDAPVAIIEDPSPAMTAGTEFTIGGAGPYTPARVAEDIYGEPGEWIWGISNLLRDWYAHVDSTRGVDLTAGNFRRGFVGVAPEFGPIEFGRNNPARFTLFDQF